MILIDLIAKLRHFREDKVKVRDAEMLAELK